MSFIGLSRDGRTQPLGQYVCLDKQDCFVIHKLLENRKKELSKIYERYLDIHDSGEITRRQQTALCVTEDALEKIEALCDMVKSYLNQP